MPFVKFPTNTGGLGNKQVEGGVILPLALELPHGWNMGLMTEFDILYFEEGGYGPGFVNSITFGHAIVGHLSGYAELFSDIADSELIIPPRLRPHLQSHGEPTVRCGLQLWLHRGGGGFQSICRRLDALLRLRRNE